MVDVVVNILIASADDCMTGSKMFICNSKESIKLLLQVISDSSTAQESQGSSRLQWFGAQHVQHISVHEGKYG